MASNNLMVGGNAWKYLIQGPNKLGIRIRLDNAGREIPGAVSIQAGGYLPYGNRGLEVRQQNERDVWSSFLDPNFDKTIAKASLQEIIDCSKRSEWTFDLPLSEYKKYLNPLRKMAETKDEAVKLTGMINQWQKQSLEIEELIGQGKQSEAAGRITDLETIAPGEAALLRAKIQVGPSSAEIVNNDPEGRIEKFLSHGIFGLTNIGRGSRTNNQDSIAVLLVGNKTYLMVADGIGGHGGGEVASGRALQIMVDSLKNGLPVDESILAAHDGVAQLPTEAKQGKPGTTLTVVEIEQNRARIYSYGDSPVFIKRKDGRLEQLTKPDWDVSQDELPEELLTVLAKNPPFSESEMGQLRANPISKIVYALGLTMPVELRAPLEVKLQPDEYIIAACDGIEGALPLEQLKSIFFSNFHPDTIGKKLMKLALETQDAQNEFMQSEAGKRIGDNLSLIIYQQNDPVREARIPHFDSLAIATLETLLWVRSTGQATGHGHSEARIKNMVIKQIQDRAKSKDSTVEEIERFLGSDDPDIFSGAVKMLKDLEIASGSPAAIDILRNRHGRESDPELKILIAEVLKNIYGVSMTITGLPPAPPVPEPKPGMFSFASVEQRAIEAAALPVVSLFGKPAEPAAKPPSLAFDPFGSPSMVKLTEEVGAKAAEGKIAEGDPFATRSTVARATIMDEIRAGKIKPDEAIYSLEKKLADLESERGQLIAARDAALAASEERGTEIGRLQGELISANQTLRESVDLQFQLLGTRGEIESLNATIGRNRERIAERDAKIAELDQAIIDANLAIEALKQRNSELAAHQAVEAAQEFAAVTGSKTDPAIDLKKLQEHFGIIAAGNMLIEKSRTIRSLAEVSGSLVMKEQERSKLESIIDAGEKFVSQNDMSLRLNRDLFAQRKTELETGMADRIAAKQRTIAKLREAAEVDIRKHKEDYPAASDELINEQAAFRQRLIEVTDARLREDVREVETAIERMVKEEVDGDRELHRLDEDLVLFEGSKSRKTASIAELRQMLSEINENIGGLEGQRSELMAELQKIKDRAVQESARVIEVVHQDIISKYASIVAEAEKVLGTKKS